MKVLTYRELESKDGLLPLLDHAFNWAFDERQFDRFAEVDPRLKNSPVGFCALEDGRIVGFVGVMDVATRTLEDTTEPAGGLYGVATLPGFTRRGIFTTLMEKAHEYFKEKDYRFSLLGTSSILIAHKLYAKLGYEDVIEYPSAYKVVRNKSRNIHVGGLISVFDPQKMLRIYDNATRRMTGLVVRDISYFKMLRKVEGIKPKQCLIGDEGYVIFKEDRSTIWVRELIATSSEEAEKLVASIEQRGRAIICDRVVMNRTLLEVYRSRGYLIQERGYAVMMCKSMTPEASFSRTYGNSFFLTRLDSF
jgi:GNAT superfamily N-acetyltransferase